MWIQGTDISPSMLDIAHDREVEGDVCLSDLGHGVPFRMGSFDGAISISAVQWLCNADASYHDPRKRLKRFFETLYACLSKGGRAVLQIYPKNTEQASMISNAAMKVGFSGGLVVDFPNSTKAKKYFLVLMVGGSAAIPQAKGIDDFMGEEDDEEYPVEHRNTVRMQGRKTRHAKGDKASGRSWILRKKEQQRKRGYADIRPDSKYTGRKRKDKF